MAALTPPSSSDSNRLSTFSNRASGKGIRDLPPPAPYSEPGLSRDSSVSSGVSRRVSRKVVPGLPRAKTFRRQQSENRDKLEAVLPTAAERRAVSVDRRLRPQRSASFSSQALPRATAPDFFFPETATCETAAISTTSPVTRSLFDELHRLSHNDTDATSIGGGEDHGNGIYPEATDAIDVQSNSTSQYDAMIREELEREWILNISMHFRDKSMREKFFVTYREQGSMIWRRVTISLDYRNAPNDSLEKELLNTKFQREKSARIYEAIRDSLQDIQFYTTVTNLKLETAEGRLHVHVVEDVNEIITFPTIQMVEHIKCHRIRERDVEFDAHMSGFVYRVRVNGRTLIKKEIPGPNTVDEFLYEINALNSLRYSRSIIEFYGVVVDDDYDLVKGLLISYAEHGALIDVIYDSRERGEQELPWATRERWARQIVQGLSDIHESGFVQGDFTLSNIVIDDHGNAKIIDINRRGCPVGWEPPEAYPLIGSNQRIAMYIGVKSDLYQLGMVLWALATLEDEPEAHPRPLRFEAELDVPLWYRNIVETCLEVDPRRRLQATALLAQFPELPYDDAYEERELPMGSMHDSTVFQRYASNGSYTRPGMRSSWPYSSGSNTQATSPSSSEELYYPPRGRSPPSPSPSRHELYNMPHLYSDVLWAKDGKTAFMGDGPIADEMTDELEQLEASFCPENVPSYEQTEAPDDNSLAQDTVSRTVIKTTVPADGLDGNIAFKEESVDHFTFAHDPTASKPLEITLGVEKLQPNKCALPRNLLENVEAAEKESQDDGANAVFSLQDYQTAPTQPPDIAEQAGSTAAEPSKTEMHFDHLNAAYAQDIEEEDIATRTADLAIFDSTSLEELTAGTTGKVDQN